jgi:hypothetical protein
MYDNDLIDYASTADEEPSLFDFTVVNRFRMGSEDYVTIFMSPVGPNDEKLVPQPDPVKNAVPKVVTSIEEVISTPETPKPQTFFKPEGSEGKGRLYSRVQGKVRAVTLTNTKGWGTTEWYRFISDKSATYEVECPVKTLTGVTRKVLALDSVSLPAMREILYSTSAGAPEMPISDLLPLIEKAMTDNVTVGAQLTALLHTNVAKVLDALKSGNLTTNPNVLRRFATYILGQDIKEDNLGEEAVVSFLTKLIGSSQ